MPAAASMSSPSLPRAANGLGRPGAPVGGRPSLRDAVCAHFKRPAKERGPERRLLKDSFPRKQMAPLMRLPKKWPQCPRQTKENTEDAFTVAPRRISVTDIRSPFGSFFFFGECGGNTERLRAEVVARSEMWASCASGTERSRSRSVARMTLLICRTYVAPPAGK